MSRHLVPAAAVLALLAPASASAAVRYADPSVQIDSSAPCTQASPCSIVKAINQAAKDDEVVLKTGDYQLIRSGVTLEPPQGKVVIHGDYNQPRPRIISDSDQVLFVQRNSTAAWLAIQDSAAGAAGLVVDQTSAATQVVSRVDGANGTPCSVLGALDNSVCVTAGAKAQAVQSLLTRGATATPLLRNVTAVATAPDALALDVEAPAVKDRKPGNVQLTAQNVLAFGGTPGSGGYDVFAKAEGGSTARATLDYSNYNTVQLQPGGGTASVTPAGTAHNQKLPPTFADLPNGDLHENPCSPTVGAGVIDQKTGTLDADRAPRTLEGKIDIGAYENTLSCASDTTPAPTAPAAPTAQQ